MDLSEPSLNSHALAAFDRMVGEARVVALTEPVHCAREPLELRNALARHLVQAHGFSAVAIESGLVESRLGYDYVRGEGGLPEALADGLSWTFGELPQNAQLLTWLRGRNSSRGTARPVNFYGFDVSGSPGNAEAVRGVATAWQAALGYLGAIDPQAASRFEARVSGLAPRLRFDLMRGPRRGYESFTLEERETLSAAIGDLLSRIAAHTPENAAARREHAWGLRSAVAAAQVDAWLRCVPLDWRPLDQAPTELSNELAFLQAAGDVRDLAQAANIRWILEQEGPGSRVLVFAARCHLSAGPLSMSTEYGSGGGAPQIPAGVHLRRALGKDFVTIGALLGGGEAGCGAYRGTFPPPRKDSLDGWARGLETGDFLLDLRQAPPAAKAWLTEPSRLVVSGCQILELRPAEAFDGLVYFDRVTAASAGAQARC